MYHCTKDLDEIAKGLVGKTIGRVESDPARDFLMISFTDGNARYHSVFVCGRKPEGSVETGITYGEHEMQLAVWG